MQFLRKLKMTDIYVMTNGIIWAKINASIAATPVMP
jgi:hypothetical protein